MEHNTGKQIKLTDDARHKAVHDYLFEMVKQEPDLYYSSTSDVARRIHDLIQEREHDLSIEEKKILESLTVEQISEIMSFHSHPKHGS